MKIIRNTDKGLSYLWIRQKIGLKKCENGKLIYLCDDKLFSFFNK